MTSLEQEQIPDLTDWAGSPLSTVHHPPPSTVLIPMEQYRDGGGFVIRLELPGIEAPEDLAVTVQAGTLGVRAERRRQAPQTNDSEFRYGTYARHVPLPHGSNAKDVTASYRNGILTIRVGTEPDRDPGPHVIAVELH